MTILIFIIVLSILVIVHELGHFIMAKRAGMKVEEFGFGFPPRLFGYKKGETTYSINAIPFGGFVKVLGEDGEERGNPQSFSSKSFKERVAVIVAGVVMNIFLAIVLLIIVNSVGLHIALDENDPTTLAKATDIKVQVTQVSPDSPAADSGIKVLDEIVGFRVAGSVVRTESTEKVRTFIDGHRGQQITVILANGGQRDVVLTPRTDVPAGQGAVGIAMSLTGKVRYPIGEAITKSIQYSGIIFVNTMIGLFYFFKQIITTGVVSSDVAGPIGIAIITGQAARIGFAYLLQFMALISINLAVLNILPVPALDGGRLLFLVIEKIRGRALSKRIEGSIHAIGFALLIILMVYITTRDILKFF